MHTALLSGMYTSQGSGRVRGAEGLHALEHLKKSAGRVRGAKGIKRHNALFHLFENASKSAQMYDEILPTSTHAHKYIT